MPFASVIPIAWEQLPVYDRGAESDAIEVIKMCMAHGADINAGNELGDTAMHGAALRGRDHPVPRVPGAKVDAKNRQDRTTSRCGARIGRPARRRC